MYAVHTENIHGALCHFSPLAQVNKKTQQATQIQNTAAAAATTNSSKPALSKKKRILFAVFYYAGGFEKFSILITPRVTFCLFSLCVCWSC